jgi:hypothetical protein
MRNFPLKRLSAVFPVATLGLFAYGCWFIRSLALETNVFFFIFLTAGLIGTVESILWFWWGTKNKPSLPGLRTALGTGAGFLAVVFLLFLAWNRSQPPSRFVNFLLPSHTFEASVHPAGNSPVTALQFNTALGKIPLETIEFTGWELTESGLLLSDPANNRIRWSGKPGDEVQFTFQAEQKGEVSVAWDGNQATVPLLPKKHTYSQPLPVPFYAVQQSLLLLALFLNLVIVAFPFAIFFWQARYQEIGDFFHATIRGAAGRLNGRDWLLVAGGILLAAALRLRNLDMWSMVGVDEYSHLIAARFIVATGSLNVDYQRSLWVVTIPISLAFRWLGQEVWAARLVGVVFNVFAVLPLYLIGRKIDQRVAAFAILLFATSPWEIAFSRIIREYAYYPLYFYWITYGMIVILEKIPAPFRIERDWKTLLRPPLFWTGLALMLPLLYTLWVDPYSTLKVILIGYAVWAVFLLSRFDLNDRATRFLLLGLAAALLAGWFLFRPVVASFPAPGWNLLPIRYFLPNPAQQWYYDRPVIFPLIGLLAAFAASLMIRRTNVVPLFITALFASLLGFFVFFPKPPFFAPRHLSMANHWYILLAALASFLVYRFIQTSLVFKTRPLKIGVIAALALLTFNPVQSLISTQSAETVSVISHDLYYDFRDLQTYMTARVEPGDILIASTPYLRHSIWMDAPDFSARFPFLISPTTQSEEILVLTRQHSSGWIVLDAGRMESLTFSPLEAFATEPGLEYLGLVEDEHVWHWKRP